MITILGIYFTYSKFSSSKEEEVVRTTVSEFIHGDVVIGAYIDGEYSKTIPGKDDGYIVKNVVCDNGAVGTWNDDKWGLLTTNMTKRSKCNVYFETKKPSVVEAVTTAMSADSSMFANDDPDSNIRYIGSNPSNYVYFNCSDYSNQSDSTCEKWRIIGVFNNTTKSDGTKENLVKIIREESIGNYSWDYTSSDSYLNDWSNGTLQKLLNSGAYYNGITGIYYNGSTTATNVDFTSTGLKNDITRNTIESVVWNLGGVDSPGLPVSTFYTEERGTTVYSGRPTTWAGKIGLMYSSDYGYATSGGATTNRVTCLSTNLRSWNSYSDCYGNDYLFNNTYQWTLVSRSGNANYVFFIYTSGYVTGYGTNYTLGVRPALYLKSNISVKSGNGTSSTPYQLNL